MRKLLLLVEGLTEHRFVEEVLAGHLRERGINARSVIISTRRVKSGGKFRGGIVSTAQVLYELRQLLGDSSAIVTTILDYYGLPDDFPGLATRPPRDPRARVEHVEAELSREGGDRRFLPHLVLHEYEAWIFSDPMACAWVLEPTGLAEKLSEVRDAVRGPELIDEGRDTAPSKRLLKLWPGYEKVLHGPRAVAAIGLQTLRSRCPHADAWLKRLEAL